MAEMSARGLMGDIGMKYCREVARAPTGANGGAHKKPWMHVDANTSNVYASWLYTARIFSSVFLKVQRTEYLLLGGGRSSSPCSTSVFRIRVQGSWLFGKKRGAFIE